MEKLRLMVPCYLGVEKLVADELKKQFGDELTYRMGGDEYVAFAPDLSEDRLHEKVRTFSLAIEQKDYHAALG